MQLHRRRRNPYVDLVPFLRPLPSVLGLVTGWFAPTIGGCFHASSTNDTAGTESATEGSTGGSTSLSTVTTVEPTTTISGTTTASDTGSTGAPECTVDGDCADMAAECQVATCDGGTCQVSDADEGTPCGDATDDDCTAPDTCDAAGTCLSNDSDGASCDGCSADLCSCMAGTCVDCSALADTNLFTTPRSIVGWELTGGWGLFTGAPEAQDYGTGVLSPAIPFGSQVLGTDGNRVPPYPGGELEQSYAHTPPFELPATLDFQSWHLDEGGSGEGNYDGKMVRVSVDGGATWTTLVDCLGGVGTAPFCSYVTSRTGDNWDIVSLPIPGPMVGQTGIVELAYDTGDNCCQFERGWFIDVTEFATECACTSDASCQAWTTDCGTGVCGSNGACNLMPQSGGTACGSTDENTCTIADVCDGIGLLRRRRRAQRHPLRGLRRRHRLVQRLRRRRVHRLSRPDPARRLRERARNPGLGHRVGNRQPGRVAALRRVADVLAGVGGVHRPRPGVRHRRQPRPTLPGERD